MRIRTIRGKILVSILGTLIVGILLVVSVSSYMVFNFSTESADQTFEVMKQEELSNLQVVAKDTSLLVDEYIKGVRTDIKMAWEYATDLFNGRVNATPIESYWADSSVDLRTPPGKFVEDYYGLGPASWDVTTIFAPGVTTPGQFGQFQQDHRSLIDTSSNLEFIFKSIHASNPNYIWIYMGFEEASFFRQLPYNDMSWAREESYNVKQENWYTKAVAKDGLNTFLDLDPESGLVLTSSMPVKYDNGTLVGVISIDLPLGAVQEAILGATVLQNGYSFLTDTDGNIMMHPALVDDAGLFGTSVNDLESTAFSTVLSTSKSENGQSTYIKSGKLWYASYEEVDSGFILFTVVPESDILQPAQSIRDRIFLEFWTGMLLFLVLVALLATMIVLVARWISDRIVDPVNELNEVCQQITRGDLSRDLMGQGGSSAEVSMLYDTFSGLVTTLRFGNEEYYAGNLNRAMDNYQKALDLFRTLKNRKGEGICLNNIGNIHRALGNLKDANAAYRESISIAEELLENADEADRIDLTVSLASRYNNIGLLFRDIEQYDRAEEYINKALDLDRQVDNSKGFASRYGNLGTIALQRGDLKRAKTLFDEEMSIATSLGSDRALAYARFNQGMYHRATGATDLAIEDFMQAVKLSEEIDVRVGMSSLKNLEELYREKGETQLADEISNKINNIASSAKRKEVTFVIDTSGSMAGKRMTTARKGMIEIFKNQVGPKDIVRLIKFSSRVQELIPPTIKEGNERMILLTMNKLTRPTGSTAFYDALGKAFEELDRTTALDSWLIALTDGDDNSSKVYTISKLKKMARESVGTNLVIIGVGRLQDTEHFIEMCEATDNGRYIDVSSGVGEAISSAFEEVSTMLMSVDVEGFVPDN